MDELKTGNKVKSSKIVSVIPSNKFSYTSNPTPSELDLKNANMVKSSSRGSVRADATLDQQSDGLPKGVSTGIGQRNIDLALAGDEKALLNLRFSIKYFQRHEEQIPTKRRGFIVNLMKDRALHSKLERCFKGDTRSAEKVFDESLASGTKESLLALGRSVLPTLKNIYTDVKILCKKVPAALHAFEKDPVKEAKNFARSALRWLKNTNDSMSASMHSDYQKGGLKKVGQSLFKAADTFFGYSKMKRANETLLSAKDVYQEKLLETARLENVVRNLKAKDLVCADKEADLSKIKKHVGAAAAQLNETKAAFTDTYSRASAMQVAVMFWLPTKIGQISRGVQKVAPSLKVGKAIGTAQNVAAIATHGTSAGATVAASLASRVPVIGTAVSRLRSAATAVAIVENHRKNKKEVRDPKKES